ncbi:hypothetical protein HYH03_013031 [Edaphochlamys debaryana]|uniref:Glycosyl transferase CAP10 domain-containing protein n=1 Tax=Edaphochlamys debaryana TaxID=47281 RepID=A0A835XQP5_9CHLO|nr:hypothetical protein HYH03_013031 [Edaphochlamys debaryana]|eukprot:KAG2488341.1 hypothetical protein HYH03_013031 [Edaphochlamys debaryana]
MLARIQKDIAWIDKVGGITDAMIRNISLVCNKQVSCQCNTRAIRMMIKDGELYLTSVQPGFRLGPQEFAGFLLELYETTKLYRLPDVEFAYNGDDDANSPVFNWADGKEGEQSVFHGGPFPLLTWSKGPKSFGILTPYSGAFRCVDDSFDSILMRLDEIQRSSPWEEKKSVAFGRWNEFCAVYVEQEPPLPDGSYFPCPRRHWPKLTDQHKDIMDVRVLHTQVDGKAVASVPLMHQNRWKYLVSTDGWAISSKFDKYLLLGSTIIKSWSSRFGFYYDALKPGEHYLLAMTQNSTDLIQAIRWAQANDQQAATIAANAQRFAVRHLHRRARLCYYRILMEELAKRMKYVPDCSKRTLCIPAGQFLEFMTTYPRTYKSCMGTQEVLMRHGVNYTLQQGKYPRDRLQAMLADERLFPIDTDIPLMDDMPYFIC